MPPRSVPPLHVSLLAISEGSISTLYGLYDVLNSFPLLAGLDEAVPSSPPFRVEIVGAVNGSVRLASGLDAQAHQGVADVRDTNIVIVPSVVLPRTGWRPGRYPQLVDWLTRAHARGAILCSACSGVFLLAETGLFDGRDATMHWSYVPPFRALFPQVRLFPERTLVAAGARNELVTSGASTSWHDLVLYLIARHVNPAAAQAVAKFFALQWHRDGLGPYMIFEGRRDHGDAAVLAAQTWLEKNAAAASPVEAMVRRSGMAERTFKRRFTEATGLAPLAYVQQLRVAEAKRRLERTQDAVDEIAWRVGYEDPAFFRRLFKRVTGLSPAGYRRKLQVPPLPG
jgi:transcriptional regulator GlxA family with amidase domain